MSDKYLKFFLFKRSDRSDHCLGDCPPEFLLMLQTPKAQNIENRRQMKCTISLDLFRALLQSELDGHFPIFFRDFLYALRSFYGCPMIVQ